MARLSYSNPSIKRLALILLALGLISLPFGFSPLSNLSLAVLALLSILSFKRSDWKYSLKQPASIASILFFSLYALSLFYSENVDGGQADLETKFSFLLAPLILFGLGQYLRKDEINKISWLFIGANLACLISALAYAGWRSYQSQSFSFVLPNGTQEHFYFLYETFAEPFMHPGYLSTHFGIAIILLLFRWREKENQALLVFPLIFFLSFGLFLLQGRINILALALVIGTLLVYWWLKDLRWKALLVSGALVFALVISFLSFAPQSVKERYLAFPDFSYDISGSSFNSATYRLAEWKCAWHAIAQKPWFGHGIGDAEQVLFNSYQELGFHQGLERRYNAHNQYLETSLALGLMGFLVLLSLLAAYMWQAIKSRNSAVLAALVFFSISMITESMFERAWAVVLFNVFFPLFLIKKKEA